MTNYYKLLEISQDALQEEIVSAIKKTRRIWNNRANSPDSSIRAEAEQHIKEIAEAETILLNPNTRREYNEQLSTATNQEIDSNTNCDPSADWEEDFFKAYNNDFCDIAEEIAGRMIQRNERNGRAWFLYGEAIRKGGDISRSVEPLRRASMLSPNDADIYRQLGFAYDSVGEEFEAYKAFFRASKIEPQNAEYHSLCAACLRIMNQISEALSEAKLAYNIAPDDDNVKFEYFCVLYYDSLNAASYNRSSGKHLITNKKQLEYLNNNLKLMAMVIPQGEDNGECMKRMDELASLVADAESKKGGFFLSKPGYQYNYDISNDDTRSSGLH